MMILVKVPEYILHQYRKEVKGSQDESLELIRKKFTRNMLLSYQTPRANEKGVHCAYGKLHFIVDDTDTVVWMKNHLFVKDGWKKDFKRYIQLNKELGIENKYTLEELYARDTYYKTKGKINRIKWKVNDKIKDNGYIKLDSIVSS